MPLINIPEISSGEILKKYQRIRSYSETICEPLQTEDYVAQPVMDVSPPKWHLAHTTWFFENFILVPNKPDYRVFHDQFAFLFNSYYVTAGDRWTRALRGDLTRPTVKEIYQYRQYVDSQMQEFLQNHDVDSDLLYVFEIGFQHEQQHQELLYYDLKYILGCNPLFPVYKKGDTFQSEASKLGWLSLDEGLYAIGHTGDNFCFDNELESHKVFLPSFSISDRLVSNGEYLEFVKNGGYHEPTLWLSEGWDWLQQNEVLSPLYWHEIDGDWMNYTLSGLQHIDAHEPVSHVSFYEADAYARWKGLRLPSEFEWETACKHFEPTPPEIANFNDREFLKPVNHGTQFFGNLWEWTESAYRPYPNYQPEAGTLGEYNGKFMMNTMVLRGGSYATSRDHIRSTYRNFFHPHLQWMFSGIRLAKSQ